MKDETKLWLVLRIAWVTLGFITGFGDQQDLSLTWIKVIGIGGITAFIAFASCGWETDYTDPYSLTKPFWPMKEYPLRFWLLVAAGLITSGVVFFVRELFLHEKINIQNSDTLITGISVLIGVLPSLLTAKAKRREKSPTPSD